MKIISAYKTLPENVRLILTAIIGAIIGFVTYEIIYFFNPIEPRASSSWFIAFFLDVFRQHALHRWLTFDIKTHYWKSLLRAYIMYSSALITTTGLNFALTKMLLMNHQLAWLICILLKALISLIFLKKYVFKKDEIF